MLILWCQPVTGSMAGYGKRPVCTSCIFIIIILQASSLSLSVLYGHIICLPSALRIAVLLQASILRTRIVIYFTFFITGYYM